MTAGAADAVRGASSPAEEMRYIVQHSGACAVIAQDSATLERLAPLLATTPSDAPASTSAPQNGTALSNGRAAAAQANGNGAAHAVRLCLTSPLLLIVQAWLRTVLHTSEG
jgi:long-subunit acyl-CoA synthetase (AMP-forming)